MTNPADRIPGFSDADMAAFRVLTDMAIDTNKSVVELARTIARQRGIELPQPDQPRTRGQHGFMRIERPERGVVLADVLNERTGTVRHYEFTRADDGGVDVEEL